MWIVQNGDGRGWSVVSGCKKENGSLGNYVKNFNAIELKGTFSQTS